MSLRPDTPQTRPNAVPYVGSPVDQIVGILNMNPDVVLTVRGMLRLLQLCQVGRKMSDFLRCTDKEAWMSLYQTADARIASLGYMQSQNIRRVLVSFANAQQFAMSMDDRAAALYYKKLLTKHILYFAMFDATVFGVPSDGVVLNMTWFSAQIHTFLGRSNGSIENIVKMIDLDLQRVRRSGDYPPVPADFLVAGIRLVAEVAALSGASKYYSKGRVRLPALEARVMQKAFY